MNSRQPQNPPPAAAPPSLHEAGPHQNTDAIRRKALDILRRELSAEEFATLTRSDVLPTPQNDDAPLDTTDNKEHTPPASHHPTDTQTTHPPGRTAPHNQKPADPTKLPDAIPARMLNEFVYCPRLFYYEFVEGVFVHNADTVRGKALHRRVDQGEGALPPATRPASAPKTKPATTLSSDETTPREDASETIHSRSVQVGSKRLGVIAKIDLVQVHGPQDDLFSSREVCPVDYKAGAPKPGDEGNELWDADRMQLGLQALILRENGYICREAIVYYRATKQRVRLPITPELEDWIEDQVNAARRAAMGPIPPPLDNSPKCPRCSLLTVCLPDETRLLSHADSKTSPSPPTILSRTPSHRDPNHTRPVRRLIAARDDARALYLNTQGLRIGRKDERLVVRQEGKDIDEVRLHDLLHVALFGNIQISTQAIQALCTAEIPITYFSMGGWFYGITRGHGLKNVFLRIEQFRSARDFDPCLHLARRFIHAKIRNQRTMLMRNHLEPPRSALNRLKQFAHQALHAPRLHVLLGIEGNAASEYFAHFDGMIKATDRTHPAVTQRPDETAAPLDFHFNERNRRPPTDPVNAMLSLAYSLLAKDCTIAALTVGFDPYVGFYHQPRFGRPALALDLMEEFRPLVADSTVLSCINNRVIQPRDFVRAGRAVNLTTTARRRFFQMYEQRMNTLLIHPVFGYKVSYRRALELQARLLARVLTGEIPHYIPMTTR